MEKERASRARLSLFHWRLTFHFLPLLCRRWSVVLFTALDYIHAVVKTGLPLCGLRIFEFLQWVVKLFSVLVDLVFDPGGDEAGMWVESLMEGNFIYSNGKLLAPQEIPLLILVLCFVGGSLCTSPLWTDSLVAKLFTFDMALWYLLVISGRKLTTGWKLGFLSDPVAGQGHCLVIDASTKCAESSIVMLCRDDFMCDKLSILVGLVSRNPSLKMNTSLHSSMHMIELLDFMELVGLRNQNYAMVGMFACFLTINYVLTIMSTSRVQENTLALHVIMDPELQRLYPKTPLQVYEMGDSFFCWFSACIVKMFCLALDSSLNFVFIYDPGGGTRKERMKTLDLVMTEEMRMMQVPKIEDVLKWFFGTAMHHCFYLVMLMFFVFVGFCKLMLELGWSVRADFELLFQSWWQTPILLIGALWFKLKLRLLVYLVRVTTCKANLFRDGTIWAALSSLLKCFPASGTNFPLPRFAILYCKILISLSQFTSMVVYLWPMYLFVCFIFRFGLGH